MPSATPSRITGNAQITSSDARDHRVGPAAEVARRACPTTIDEDRRDQRGRRPRSPASCARRRAAAPRCRGRCCRRPRKNCALPGRPDRDAVGRDDVLLLAVDDDRVGQVVLVRVGVGDVLAHSGAARQIAHEHEEQRPNASAVRLRRSRRSASRHGPTPATCSRSASPRTRPGARARVRWRARWPRLGRHERDLYFFRQTASSRLPHVLSPRSRTARRARSPSPVPLQRWGHHTHSRALEARDPPTTVAAVGRKSSLDPSPQAEARQVDAIDRMEGARSWPHRSAPTGRASSTPPRMGITMPVVDELAGRAARPAAPPRPGPRCSPVRRPTAAPRGPRGVGHAVGERGQEARRIRQRRARHRQGHVGAPSRHQDRGSAQSSRASRRTASRSGGPAATPRP